MKKIIWVISPLLLFACAACKQKPETVAKVEHVTKSEANYAEEIFHIFAKPDPKKENWQGFTYYDVACTNEACEYFSLPSNVKGAKKMTLSGDKSARLIEVLRKLRTADGETGVATAYLSCNRYKLSDKFDSHCDVAITVH